MKMRILKLVGLFSITLIILTSCEKAKVRRQVYGEWKVAKYSYYEIWGSDIRDLAEYYDVGTIDFSKEKTHWSIMEPSQVRNGNVDIAITYDFGSGPYTVETKGDFEYELSTEDDYYVIDIDGSGIGGWWLIEEQSKNSMLLRNSYAYYDHVTTTELLLEQ